MQRRAQGADFKRIDGKRKDVSRHGISSVLHAIAAIAVAIVGSVGIGALIFAFAEFFGG